nr:phosphotransferase [Actinomyces culturomici]
MTPADNPAPWPSDRDLLEALHPWMEARRWFPLKGDAAPAAADLAIAVDRVLAPNVRDLLIAAPRAGADPVLIHVPLVLDEADALDSFVVEGESEGAHGLLLESAPGLALVDGPHHPDFWRAWARAAAEAGTVLGDGGAEAIAQRAGTGTVMTGEQSNTNVVMRAPEGATLPDLVVKLFRVLAPGRNPDVEVSAALASDGWDRVRRPVAWSTLSWSDPATGAELVSDSAVACTFIPKADDGFELFCDLASTDDGPTGEVRSRAVDLARDLGATTAQMHAHMAAALGTAEPVAPAELADSLRRRAQWAMDEVAFLEERMPDMREKVEEILSRLEGLDALEPACRIHGDYHLGQVLREKDAPDGAVERWFVLDFEGEPLRPLAERSMPDQPMRDVAGILRSFDYAAAVGRANDSTWLADMRAAFLGGYAAERPGVGAEDAERERVLVAALELDKALYEAVYEARNRPAWISIPLRAIEALLS